MDNPVYHPDAATELTADTRGSEVFTISHRSLLAKNNQITTISQDFLVPVNSRDSLFKKPKFYKTITIFLGIICSILLIIILLQLFIGKTFNAYCNTNECLRSAANLKYSLDLSVDPCEDFHQYTCGHWSEEHPNHGPYKSFSTFGSAHERFNLASYNFLISENENDSLPVKQSKILYKSCLNQDSSDELTFNVTYDFLKKIGLPKIPTFFSSLSEDKKANFKMDWLKVIASIKKTLKHDVFFGFSVYPNIHNVSTNAMYLGIPRSVFPLPSKLQRPQQKDHLEEQNDGKSDDDNDNAEIKYKEIIKYAITEMLRNQTSETVPDELLDQAASVIINITNTVNKFPENESDLDHSYSFTELQQEIDQFTDDEINKKMPEFLQKFIGYMFEDIENVTVNFREDRLYVQDTEKHYILHLMSYLLGTPEIYIELYLWWSTFDLMIASTTTKVVEYIAKKIQVLDPSFEVRSQSRSAECVVLVSKFMGLVVTYGIANKTSASDSALQVSRMLDDIKEGFRNSVEHLSWMDRANKIATLEKLANIYSFIGFPSWLFEDGRLEEYYKDLELNETTFLQNMLNLIGRDVPKMLRKLRVINDREFTANPTNVNAYATLEENSINVPLAILTYPMYHLGLEVLNYGAIGTVLGHELTHEFDNNGRKHDKFGNYKQWWSNETIETFEYKAKCFLNQYDNITIKGVKGRVSGQTTLGENIADNGGLNHAFAAYRNYKKRHGLEKKLPGFENYTHDQLFFIAFGSIWCENAIPSVIEIDLLTDPHCPNSVRVNMVVSNSREFSEAFQCRKGQKMNPEEKCKIW